MSGPGADEPAGGVHSHRAPVVDRRWHNDASTTRTSPPVCVAAAVLAGPLSLEGTRRELRVDDAPGGNGDVTFSEIFAEVSFARFGSAEVRQNQIATARTSTITIAVPPRAIAFVLPAG